MRSRYAVAKIAFLVLALFTVTYQCAAQCLAQPCHELGTKVPACHRHNSKNSEAPVDVCKAPLLLAEEVRIQSSDHPDLSSGMLLSGIVPDVVVQEAHLALSTGSWRSLEPPSGTEITHTVPLRI